MKGAIIINLNELKKLPINELEAPLKDKFIALRVITGDYFDNKKLIVENNGNWFSMSFYRETCQHGSIRHKELQKLLDEKVDINKTYTISLWDYKEITSVFNSSAFKVKEYDDPIPSTIIEQMKLKMDEFIEEYVHCADCDEKIKYDEKAKRRRFFAGIYCYGCWCGDKGKHKGTGGWQEVERKETYN